MSEFDPYHVWLGIPPGEQPPNYYRLLGIDIFEDQPEVIESAADRQMMMLRTFQTGPHSAESQRLLSEVAKARLCLLTPDRHAAYDRRLLDEIEAMQLERIRAREALRKSSIPDSPPPEIVPRSTASTASAVSVVSPPSVPSSPVPASRNDVIRDISRAASGNGSVSRSRNTSVPRLLVTFLMMMVGIAGIVSFLFFAPRPVSPVKVSPVSSSGTVGDVTGNPGHDVGGGDGDAGCGNANVETTGDASSGERDPEMRPSDRISAPFRSSSGTSERVTPVTSGSSPSAESEQDAEWDSSGDLGGWDGGRTSSPTMGGATSGAFVSRSRLPVPESVELERAMEVFHQRNQPEWDRAVTPFLRTDCLSRWIDEAIHPTKITDEAYRYVLLRESLRYAMLADQCDPGDRAERALIHCFDGDQTTMISDLLRETLEQNPTSSSLRNALIRWLRRENSLSEIPETTLKSILNELAGQSGTLTPLERDALRSRIRWIEVRFLQLHSGIPDGTDTSDRTSDDDREPRRRLLVNPPLWSGAARRTFQTSIRRKSSTWIVADPTTGVGHRRTFSEDGMITRSDDGQTGALVSGEERDAFVQWDTTGEFMVINEGIPLFRTTGTPARSLYAMEWTPVTLKDERRTRSGLRGVWIVQFRKDRQPVRFEISKDGIRWTDGATPTPVQLESEELLCRYPDGVVDV
ncbi:MAG: hypothetical protein Q4C47_05550, partial [Planctomycetia bacterium]|nr:hypothetical protein [Planctomycetia bacterium]